MKIKVSFSKVVDADSIDEAYSKITKELSPSTPVDTSQLDKHTYMRCYTQLTDMGGFTFEELGTHSGYGEGSAEPPSIQDYIDQ
jgi:hypothetical protein|tara:strand:+ start:237 stop:488 length:252 start_codon:yes stop_codon:yes gene_type:complete